MPSFLQILITLLITASSLTLTAIGLRSLARLAWLSNGSRFLTKRPVDEMHALRARIHYAYDGNNGVLVNGFFLF